MNTHTRWQSAPRRTSVLFLLAVFCVFASFGFAFDVIGLGDQSAGHLAVSVIASGLFATSYAFAGMSMRGRSWMVFIGLFAVQFLVQALLGRYFPNHPAAAQGTALAMQHLHTRMEWNGFSIIVAVCLGYTGFLIVSISEARRYIRIETEKTMLMSEIAAAREVQRVMVPEALPEIAGYTLESVYKPAAEVGGDFFQVTPLSSGRTLVVIGDVSGKGLRAAMVVSMIVGTLRTIGDFVEEPAEILGVLNRKLAGHMQEGFATCLALRLASEGDVVIANAGHIPPYRNGEAVPLEGSLPLGISPEMNYSQSRFMIAPGETITLMTDGIAEAQDGARDLFGFARVEELMRQGATAHAIAKKAQQFGQSDDITVIELRRKA